MRCMWLWLRADGQPPKVVGAGVIPPGPGRVVVVSGARDKQSALTILRERDELLARLGGEPSPDVARAIAAADASGRVGFLLSAVRDAAQAELTIRYGSIS